MAGRAPLVIALAPAGLPFAAGAGWAGTSMTPHVISRIKTNKNLIE